MLNLGWRGYENEMRGQMVGLIEHEGKEFFQVER